ncbi:MAG: hypothetical protein M1819_005824 [Sarea resinae]|nr:MAG: hypothetical protein M1819_005824 [Sarea resinae]
MLSRSPKPALTQKGYQVIVVDYNSQNSLRFALAGIDVVISTISGNPQIYLIDAAVYARVSRFAPSEFEGSPYSRPPGSPLDRGKAAALARLQHWRQYGLQSTVFVCGIFYERFGPGGLAAYGIGAGSGCRGEGDYIMDIRNRKANIPNHNASGQFVRICMTSVNDVARFVVAALDLPQWPAELRMCGERLSVSDVVQKGQALRGGPAFQTAVYPSGALQSELTYARANQDVAWQYRLHHLIATAEGRFDFGNPNMNLMVPITTESFSSWLQKVWGPILGT